MLTLKRFSDTLDATWTCSKCMKKDKQLSFQDVLKCSDDISHDALINLINDAYFFDNDIEIQFTDVLKNLTYHKRHCMITYMPRYNDKQGVNFNLSRQTKSEIRFKYCKQECKNVLFRHERVYQSYSSFVTIQHDDIEESLSNVIILSWGKYMTSYRDSYFSNALILLNFCQVDQKVSKEHVLYSLYESCKLYTSQPDIQGSWKALNTFNKLISVLQLIYKPFGDLLMTVDNNGRFVKYNPHVPQVSSDVCIVSFDEKEKFQLSVYLCPKLAWNDFSETQETYYDAHQKIKQMITSCNDSQIIDFKLIDTKDNIKQQNAVCMHPMFILHGIVYLNVKSTIYKVLNCQTLMQRLIDDLQIVRYITEVHAKSLISQLKLN